MSKRPTLEKFRKKVLEDREAHCFTIIHTTNVLLPHLKSHYFNDN
jgi:hypothetical protein